MATNRYSWSQPNDLISQIDFVNNSFGRQDAIITPSDTPDEQGKLGGLIDALKKKKITAYADIRDGKQVLVAYGFKKPEKLVEAIRSEALIQSSPQTEMIESESEQKEAKNSGLKKLVQRYSIQMAAASGLIGHGFMAYLSKVTGDTNFFNTAWRYASADAVIAMYGTDKNVDADPIMQDFKSYLSKEGLENEFVVADQGKVGLGKSFNNFMKKYSFQIANVLGASGNVSLIQAGLKTGDMNYVKTGATSLFGAGLQIFGSEKQLDQQQEARKDPLTRAINFVDANPMQIAGLTNLADPYFLFKSAIYSKQMDKSDLYRNNKKIIDLLGEMGVSTKDDAPIFSNTDQQATIDAIAAAKDVLATESKVGIFASIKSLFSKAKDAAPSTAEISSIERITKEQFVDSAKSGLAATTNLIGENGEFVDLNKALAGDARIKSGDIQKEINELQEQNAVILSAGKSKPLIKAAVALFYTGATVLRLISRKTATADENRDAFNEVYAAAAQSLLNIEDPGKREDMLMQMGHYLSTHPKMKESSQVMVEKLRERVASFDANPFIQTGSTPMAHPVADNDVAPAAAPAPVPEAVVEAKAENVPSVVTVTRLTDKAPQPTEAKKWTQEHADAMYQTREAMIEATREQAAQNAHQVI